MPKIWQIGVFLWLFFLGVACGKFVPSLETPLGDFFVSSSAPIAECLPETLVNSREGAAFHYEAVLREALCLNDPINKVDVLGLSAEEINKLNGQISTLVGALDSIYASELHRRLLFGAASGRDPDTAAVIGLTARGQGQLSLARQIQALQDRVAMLQANLPAPTVPGRWGRVGGHQFVIPWSDEGIRKGKSSIVATIDGPTNTINSAAKGTVWLFAKGHDLANPVVRVTGSKADALDQSWPSEINPAQRGGLFGVSADDQDYRDFRTFTGGSTEAALVILPFTKVSKGRNIAQVFSRGGVVNVTPHPYAGVREASAYLKSQGVSRADRVNILQSFDVRTLEVGKAGDNMFGLRFHDFGVKARPSGQYLFETFTPLTNRSNLALPPVWNGMTGIKQFQIAPGTVFLRGRVAPQLDQGSQYIGGNTQIFVDRPWIFNSLIE